jgi:peptide/nickel transport system substrate-binding protein
MIMYKFNKFINISSLVVAVLLFFLLSALSIFASEQVLKMGIDATDVHSLSLLDATQAQDGVIRTGVYEKLADYAVMGQVTEEMVPELAVSWEHSDDFKVWTFKLREGVQFHQGYGEMTAEDVKFSIDILRDPEISTRAVETFLKDIREVNILDTYTIEIVLNNPEPRYIGKSCQDATGILITSKKAFEELGDGIKTNPIGTGPFEFDEYRSMEYSKVIRFDDYWGDKKAKLDAFVVYYMPNISSRNIAIKNGDLHMIKGHYDSTWKAEMEQAGLIFDMLGPGFSSLFIFNTRIEPLDNKLVREAIAYAIDREEIGIFFGAGPQLSPVPSTWLFHTTEGIPTYDYDLEKAKEKLTEAGYPDGLVIGPQYVSESTFYKNQFDVIIAQLAEAGIDVQVTQVDHTTFHNNQFEGIQPLCLYGNGHYDGQRMMFSFFHTDAGFMNFADYHEIDDLLDSSIGKSFEEINEIVINAQQKIMEDLIVYPTVEVGIPVARRPEVDLGYEPEASIIAFYPIIVDTYIK